MRDGLVLPLKLYVDHPRVRSSDDARVYVREAVATVKATGLDVVDWALDPRQPVTHQEVYLRILVIGTMAAFGATLVRLLLVLGDLPGCLGVSAVDTPFLHPIGPDYVRGEAFPAALA